MSGQLGDLVVSLSADIARFQSDMGKAVKVSQDSANSMAKALDGVQGAIGGIGKAFGVVTAVLAGGAMFKDTISTTKEVTAEITKLKNSLGISAEEASVMRVALDDVFLSADDMAGASSRITKQLVKNEEAFKSLGVATRDNNGNFRSTTSIMTETNSKLLEFAEGTDRNVEGMKIYGKGWEEARKTLKLTAEGMAEAEKRAKELNLIFGDSGLKAVKDYKLAMKDIDDVTESLKVNLGMALIPELTNLAVAFGDGSVKMIPAFITGLHNVEAEITRMAMLTDKAGGSITTMMYYMTGGKFTDTGKWWKEQNQLYEQRYKDNEKILIKLANAEVGLDENGNPLAKGKKDKNDKKSDGGEKKESDWTSAHNKYLEYLAAYEESKAAITKNGNDLEIERNQQAYDWGLIGYEQYITKKHELTQSSMQAELDAKQKELANAKTALSELKNVEVATKAVTDASGKLRVEIEKGKNEFDVAADEMANKIAMTKASTVDIFGNANGYQQRQLALKKELRDAKANEELKTEITAKSKAEQLAIQQKFDSEMLQSQMSAANDAANLIVEISNGSKDAQLAALAVQTAIAVAQIQIQGRVAQMMALAQLGPIAGAATAAQIEAMMWINTGLTIAAGVVKGAKIDGARAAGGQVSGGASYLVGEKGPEIFTPGASGQITSNDKLNKLGNGSSISVTPVFQISTGVAETARAEIMRVAPYLINQSVNAVKQAMRDGQFQGVPA